MNERIEKLKESACPKIDWAGRYHVELNNGEKEKWMNEWFEKFAELIVRECISIVDEQKECLHEEQKYWHDRDYGYALAVNDASKGIKQHFGVEEQQKVAPKPKCSVCGTTENVKYMGGYQPYLCDSEDCIPF